VTRCFTGLGPGFQVLLLRLPFSDAARAASMLPEQIFACPRSICAGHRVHGAVGEAESHVVVFGVYGVAKTAGYVMESVYGEFSVDGVSAGSKIWSCCCDLEHLTDREVEVLCEVAAGRTNKQIAMLLNISEHTVHRHMTAMLRRTGETCRTGLVSRTYRAGILLMTEQGPSWTGRRCVQAG